MTKYYFILLFCTCFTQNSIVTKEYVIFKDIDTQEIDILSIINESDSNNLFKIEIISMNNFKSERNKIILVMPCELELSINSKLSKEPIEFKICKDRISNGSYLLVDKTSPNIYFKHDRYKIVEGNIVLRISGEFKNSLKNRGSIENNGILREWYDNGQLYLEFEMSNGIKNGLCKKWYNNGEIMQKYSYYRGRLHGNQKKWYLNGNLKAEWNYIDDNLHGVSSEWNENGKIQSVKTFKDGVLITTS